MKSFYLIALLLVVALSLSPYFLLESEAPARFAGKMVGYGVYTAKINSVDPATCGDVASASIQGNFYEGLYGYHYLKRPLEVVPKLADGLPKISEDGKVYTIKLRKDVRYSRNRCFGFEPDGRPKTRELRPDDFVLAFKRIADYHISTRLSLSFVLDKIEGMKAYRQATRRYERMNLSRYDKEDLPGVKALLDEHAVQFKLTKPFPQFLYVLAMSVYAPVPREVVDRHLAVEGDDPEIRQRQAVVGTGPYVLTQWLRGGRIVMERNPEFRKEFYPTEGAPGDREAGLLDDAGKPVPFVDVWYLTFVKETNPRWMLFEERQVDTAGIPPDVFEAVINPDRELTDKWASKRIKLIKSTYPAVYWIGFNMRDPVVGKSKSLRQALCLSYDVETHIDVLYNGRGKRAVNLLPSSFKGHKEAPGPYYRHDVKAAREKMKEARKELEAAGVIQAGQAIPTLTFDIGQDEISRRFGEFAKKQFDAIGVKLKVVLNDWPTRQQKINNKQVQLWNVGWHADYPDAENFLQLLYSPNIRRGTNDFNYENKRFDELYEKAAVIMEEDRRVALYVEMLKILNEDCPCLLLSEPLDFLLYYPWVHNAKPHPIGYGFSKYRRFDTELRRKMGGR